MPEPQFWKTMNPARLHALYGAWFRTNRQVQPAKEKPNKPGLFDYFAGGG